MAKHLRGDGKWIAAAAEVLFDGSSDLCAQAVADLLGRFGTERVLDCIADAADGAHDHLADDCAPVEGVEIDDARANIDVVRESLRRALEVL